MIGIYKVTSPSKRVYIGQSVEIEKRFTAYKRLECKKQIRLYSSLLKYGFEKHKFEIVIECGITELNELERYYQDLFECVGIRGLNCRLTMSSDRNGSLSYETKRKLSEANKGKTHMLGKNHTEESKRKMSEVRKGKKSCSPLNTKNRFVKPYQTILTTTNLLK